LSVVVVVVVAAGGVRAKVSLLCASVAVLSAVRSCQQQNSHPNYEDKYVTVLCFFDDFREWMIGAGKRNY
jgi:hypothetical protein